MAVPDDTHALATVKPLVVPEIVTLPSEVDVKNALDIGCQILAAFGPRVTVVIADMSATEFCDASGIRHLLIANDAATACGGELRVVVRSPVVQRVMQTVGVDQVLRIYSSLDEALAGKPDLTGDTKQ
jgi:anti-anti-sigma factor